MAQEDHQISHIIATEENGVINVSEVAGPGISPQELADLLGVHRMTVLKYINLKEIQAVRFGRKWRIPHEEVSRVMKHGYNLRSLGQDGQSG